MLLGPGAHAFRFRLGEIAEAAVFLAVVVAVHVVGLLSLSRPHAPARSPASIVVDLLPPPAAQAPPPEQRAERKPQSARFEPIVQNQTPRNPRPPAGARPQANEATAAAVAEPTAAPPALAVPARSGAADAPAASVPEAAPTPSTTVKSEPGESAQVADVGGAQKPPLVPPRFDAPHLRNPRAEYPRLARRMGEQGRVMLRVFVSRAGTAEKVELQSSSGSTRLDQAALDAVARWQFVPARQGGQDVGAWLLVPLVFRLDG
ncbi:MAG: energy transducer TonB [Betaproteobacteria bacterium]|nr:MAG: energy transducer TonB [Betaproteobacteria bacterium]